MDNQELMDQTSVYRYLGMNPKSWDRWKKQKDFPFSEVRVGRRLFYKKDHVEMFLKKRNTFYRKFQEMHQFSHAN